MAPAKPLSDLARAEFEARLRIARERIPEAEARAMTVARPDFGLAAVAGHWGQVAWWSRQLGLPRTEWQPAAEKSVEWLIRRLEWIDAAGAPFRRQATDWEGALASAFTSGKRELERRALALPVDTADGSLGPVGRPFADALRAVITGDDAALARAAEEASAVPDEGVIKSKGYPRIGPALQALHDRDPYRLRAELNAMCAQHVVFATRGHLRLSEGAWIIPPVVRLILLARRLGFDTDVDPEYRAMKLRMRVGYVRSWDGRPVERNAVIEATVDPVPIDQLGEALPGERPPASQEPDPNGGAGGPSAPSRRRPSARSVGRSELEPAGVIAHLRNLLDGGQGSTWQLISWALMIGDHEEAKRQVHDGLERARRLWEQSRPEPEGVLRWLRRSQTLPNHNYVRDHFALALATGDAPAIEETASLLRRWMDAVEEDRRRRPIPVAFGAYAHASGYLDLLADVLDGGRTMLRASADAAGGPAGIRSACLGLVTGDADLLTHGLNTILEEHARALERRSSPPPPLCREAVALAATASRLEVKSEIDARYRAYAVPIVVREGPGARGLVGRLPLDLMGSVFFTL